MATEDQILQLFNDAANLRSRIDYCCRDIVIWKTYIRIVEEKTGIVVSDFFDNMTSGMTKRGVPFTVEFAREFDESKFIMDRSGGSRTHIYGQYNFTIRSTNLNGSITTRMIEDQLASMLNDYYENISVNEGVRQSYWPFSSSSYQPSNIMSGNSSITKPLPQTVTTRDNIYHIYKDSTDNKIKIDILGKNQFEYVNSSTITKAYDTVFVTQWVLREGASL